MSSIEASVLEKLNIDLQSLYKMNFIYNAIQDGWEVKKLKNNKFEFKNFNKEIRKEFFLESFLDKFVENHLTIENLFEL